VSALRSPNRHQTPVRDQVAADDQVEDFLEFWRAGESAEGWFRCVDCGFGVATLARLPLCARCHGRVWERAETSPFETGPPPPALSADLHDLHAVAAAVHGLFLAIVLGVVLWLGVAGLAYGLFRLIHG
jgi:hypothetical protein